MRTIAHGLSGFLEAGLPATKEADNAAPGWCGDRHELDACVRAIANVTRRNILRWLKEPLIHFPDQPQVQDLGVCMGEITRQCDLSQSTVSHHLTELRKAGLLTMKQVGTFRFFKRNEQTIEQLRTALSEYLR
jgi:ArsR family transcriptional regulator